MAACGVSNWPGPGAEPGDPSLDWAAGPDCQYFSSLTHPTRKQPHPLAVNAACIFHLWAIILRKKYQPGRKILAKFKGKGLGNGKSFETSLGWGLPDPNFSFSKACSELKGSGVM